MSDDVNNNIEQLEEVVEEAVEEAVEEVEQEEENVSEPEEPTMEDFGDMLDAYGYDTPRRGQILEGIVIEVSEDEVILDVGLKHDALVQRQDLDRLDEETIEQITVGSEFKVYVITTQNKNGDLIVSIHKALSLKDWDKATVLMESGDIVEAKVVDVNRGGLLVQFGRLRGFVPQSLIDNSVRTQSQKGKRALVGTQLNLKIIEVNQQRNRLVFSEKAARTEVRRAKLEGIEEGQVVTGTVVSLVDYGAFVDIGGVDGLIHISKLDWQHVKHPREVLSVGDEVEVQIEEVDIERERVSLNRKALMPSPWETIAQNYKVGDMVTGTVTNIADFGVFVELAANIEGLVHVSEMSNFGNDPRKLVQRGDAIPVRIISIEVDRQRIGLSMDRVSVEEQMDWMAQRAQNEEDVPAEDEYDTEEAETVETDAEAPMDEVEAVDEAEATEEVSEETEETDEEAEDPADEVEAVEEAEPEEPADETVADETALKEDAASEDEEAAEAEETDEEAEEPADEVEAVEEAEAEKPADETVADEAALKEDAASEDEEAAEAEETE